MNLEQEVAILRRVPLFAGIDNAKLKLMAFASERMDFKPGQALCRQGEPGDCAYIILSGQAAVTIDTDNGPLQVAEVGANEIVGEIAILIDVPRTATVAATMASTWARSLTSQVIEMACPPASFISETVSAAPSAPRSATATRAPSFAKRTAAARPMPRAAPVTRATFPSSMPPARACPSTIASSALLVVRPV